jgi:hypothetical protein
VTPEERLTKLEEQMLVNASLMNRIEQNMDRLEQKSEAHEDGIAELRVTHIALMKTVDQFLRGKGSNGQKQ